jgi:hypothetical protein
VKLAKKEAKPAAPAKKEAKPAAKPTTKVSPEYEHYCE